MAGPWEKYATPAEGPWEKYASTGKPVDQETFESRARKSALDSPVSRMLGIKEFASGDPNQIAAAAPVRFAVGAAEPVIGAAQMVGAPFGITGGIDSYNEMALAGGAPAKYDVPRIFGNVLSPATLGIIKATPIAKTYLGGAAQATGLGVVGGAMAPADDWKQRVQNMLTGAQFGGAVGLTVPPILGVLGMAANAGKHIVEPWFKSTFKNLKGRTLNDAAGADRQAVINALETSTPAVQGSVQNAGQAALPAKSPTFSALQNEVESRLPKDYFLLNESQEQARASALRAIGKDENALNAAKQARSTASTANYGAAETQLIKSDKQLEALMKTPALQDVLRRAEKLSGNQRKLPFIIGESAPEQVVASKLVDASGNPIGSRVIPEKFAEYPVQSLHNVKLVLDDAIKSPETFGIGASEVNALNKIRAEYLQWLESKSSAYKFARSEHSRLSKPINQLEVGQLLEKNLTNSLGSGERAGVFSRSVVDAPRTLKKATGFDRFNKLEEVLDPTQVKLVGNVMQDLSDQATFNQLASAGRQELGRTLMTNTQRTVETPPALHTLNMILRNGLERMQGKANEKVLKELAKDMQDPRKVAEVMKAVKPEDKEATVELIGKVRMLMATNVGNAKK